MGEAPLTFQLGDARVSIFNAGMLRAVLGEWYTQGWDEWPEPFRPALAAPLQVPVQCILVELPHTTVLVDAGTYDFAPDSPFAIPGYVPPPPLLEQMRASEIKPEAVDHVIITHSHFDHFNAVTTREGAQWVPAFPNARVYLGRGDWESESTQADLQNPTSEASRTFGVLQAHGRLVLADGDRGLASGVEILATPGETPGHQAVRIESAGRSLYCLGDLVHHEVEVMQLEWAVQWADSAAAAASRRTIFSRVAAENAALIATHIEGVGRVRRVDGGWQWQEQAV